MSEAYLSEWVRKAEADYEAATILIRKRQQPLPDVVCFHCQQCSEKYLKAFLVKHKIAFPKTHNLLVLQKLSSTLARTPQAPIWPGVRRHACAQMRQRNSSPCRTQNSGCGANFAWNVTSSACYIGWLPVIPPVAGVVVNNTFRVHLRYRG